MAIADTDSEFDTLAYARTLREGGVEERQAEAHATRLRGCRLAARAIRAGLATKADLDAGLGRLDARIDGLETRLNARIDTRIAGLETRMLRVAIAIVLAQTALTAGLTFGLLRMFGGAP